MKNKDSLLCLTWKELWNTSRNKQVKADNIVIWVGFAGTGFTQVLRH